MQGTVEIASLAWKGLLWTHTRHRGGSLRGPPCYAGIASGMDGRFFGEASGRGINGRAAQKREGREEREETFPPRIGT